MKPMPLLGPKDSTALHPIHYYWNMYFTRDAATKTIALKPDVEFDQTNAMFFYFKDMYENSHLASTSEYDNEDTSNHMHMVPILRLVKIYKFNDWQMCFLRQEGDNGFYQRLIHDIPLIRTCFIFNLHQYPKAAMQRVIVKAWTRHPILKKHLFSPDQNPWVPCQGMVAELQSNNRRSSNFRCCLATYKLILDLRLM